MIYVVANLYGDYDRYKKILKEIKFSKQDTLFAAGNLVDGGSGGMNILLDMMLHENIFPIFGDHDLVACDILSQIAKETKKDEATPLSEKLAARCARWSRSGGEETLYAFAKLSDGDKEAVLEYFEEFSLFEEVEAGGQSFVIVNNMPSDFVEGDELENYGAEEIFAGKIDYDRDYFPGKALVTAGKDDGRLVRKNNVVSLNLSALCLDTGEEFYVI